MIALRNRGREGVESARYRRDRKRNTLRNVPYSPLTSERRKPCVPYYSIWAPTVPIRERVPLPIVAVVFFHFRLTDKEGGGGRRWEEEEEEEEAFEEASAKVVAVKRRNLRTYVHNCKADTKCNKPNIYLLDTFKMWKKPLMRIRD